MKIVINEKAGKVLKGIKKHLDCSDSTAILIMHDIVKMHMRYKR